MWTPRRPPISPLPASVVAVRIPAGEGPRGPFAPLEGFRLGYGPRVLLIHGWEGQSADMLSIALNLADDGYEVIALDLPAHGRSGGTTMTVPEAARAIGRLAALAGRFDGVVTHSMGGIVLAHALTLGLWAARVVLLAAPVSQKAMVEREAARQGLGEAEIQALSDMVESRVRLPLSRFDLRLQDPAFDVPALFVHSDDDQVVPLTDSIDASAAWPRAELKIVSGLGHFGLLGDEGCIEAISSFLGAAARSRGASRP